MKPNPFTIDAVEYRRVFGTLEGQKVLDQLRLLYYDVDFAPDLSAEARAYHTGQHAVVRYILDQIGE